jgi:hypothetical protein
VRDNHSKQQTAGCRKSSERSINGTTVRLIAEVEADGSLKQESRERVAQVVLDNGLGAHMLDWDQDIDQLEVKDR